MNLLFKNFAKLPVAFILTLFFAAYAVAQTTTHMAAIIYDTDQSLFSSFNHDSTEGTGIRRGIPKPTLVKNDKGVSKMEFNQSKNGWKAAEFSQAFNCTPNKTAMICYDMPFKKDSKNLWTFDSDYLCNDGTVDLEKPVATRCNSNAGSTYGFFPNRLNGLQRGINDATSLDASCTYTQCPSCADTVTAESWVPLNTTISRTCYEYGLSGTGATKAGCGTTSFGEGDFRDGDNPKIWDWNWSRPTLSRKNEYFCFETHADFTYEKGQEFFFSGDDDIWVFINNNLVIDLGGAHLAAPGYVALDSIGMPGRWQSPAQVSGLSSYPNYEPLVEGNEYKLDIFFCDRRRTMSNIRISTNINFNQTVSGREPGLYTQINPEGDEICLQEPSTSCAALKNGGAAPPICGVALAPRLSYKITVPDLSEIQLNASNDNCHWNPATTIGICYGGIYLIDGIVKIMEEHITEDYLIENGFELHAKVSGYDWLNVSEAIPVEPPSSSSGGTSSSSSLTSNPSSSSSGTYCKIANACIFVSTETCSALNGTAVPNCGEGTPIKPQTPKSKTLISMPQYYNLKGESLGSKKPAKTGVYIVRQNGANKLMVVKE